MCQLPRSKKKEEDVFIKSESMVLIFVVFSSNLVIMCSKMAYFLLILQCGQEIPDIFIFNVKRSLFAENENISISYKTTISGDCISDLGRETNAF